MGKKIAGGTIQITPEISLNVDLDANSLVDIHVAMREEELLRQEKDLQADLKVQEEEQAKRSEALTNALRKLGKKRAEEMAAKVFPTLKAFGFKALEAKCDVILTEKPKPKMQFDYFIITGKGSGAHFVATTKRTSMSALIKKMKAILNGIEESIRITKDDLLKAKQSLDSVDRMERKAKAQMAIRALESTPRGRKMLAGIKQDAVKALPAPK